MRPERILYCESNSDGTIGGSFYSLFYLVDGLDKSRFEPRVIFYQDHSLLPLYHAAGIPTETFSKPRPVHLVRRTEASSHGLLRKAYFLILGSVQRLLNLTRFLVTPTFRYAVYLKKNRIRLVHLNNSIVRNNAWMLAAILTGVRCITHERGINERFPPLSRFLAKRLDAVICISDAVRTNMVTHGVSGDRLRVIHNGLDPSRIRVTLPPSEIYEKYGIPDSAPVIGIVGNIKEWKGQETVIRAVSTLKTSFPDLRCMLVGDTAASDQYYEQRLRQLIQELGLERNIIFTGYQSNVANYLNAMHIVIHASIAPEPFGRVLIEAMAMQKPIVGSADGGVLEIVSENETGLTFPPGDAEQLANAVAKLLNDPPLRKRMGENGLARLNEHFHIRSNIAKTQALYEAIL